MDLQDSEGDGDWEQDEVDQTCVGGEVRNCSEELENFHDFPLLSQGLSNSPVSAFRSDRTVLLIMVAAVAGALLVLTAAAAAACIKKKQKSAKISSQD